MDKRVVCLSSGAKVNVMAQVSQTRVVLVLLLLFAFSGCARKDYVYVVDAATSQPIEGARVEPIYPSFSGGVYQTNAKGVVHVGGWGLPRGGYGVEVSAEGYEPVFFGTYPTSADQPGWHGANLKFRLVPVEPAESVPWWMQIP